MRHFSSDRRLGRPFCRLRPQSGWRSPERSAHEQATPIKPQWDPQLSLLRTIVRRGLIMGRCETRTGIAPFGRLLDQVLDRSPYRDAERLFCVVDSGSSHRGMASIARAKRRDPRIMLVHTPVHASWLNQVEVYFLIIQRKVLTPNDFANLDEVRTRLALYEELANRTPKPFAWKFTRQKMIEWVQRSALLFATAKTDRAEGQS